MATYRWPVGGFDPFAGLRYMQRELERLVDRGMATAQRVGGGSYPAVNVLNSPDDIIVQCEVPGVKKEDLDLSITGETLVIKGVKKATVDEEKVRYQQRERGTGDFARTIVLPDAVAVDRIEANLQAGILTIRLPKSESARPRTIQVK